MPVSSFFLHYFSPSKNLPVLQIFCSCLVEKGSVACGSGMSCCFFWALCILQRNQSRTDAATSSAAAEGTGFAPLYTSYCQYEHINVASFTPAEDLIPGIKQKNFKFKVITFKLRKSITNFNSGSNFFNFCFLIAYIFHKQFSSIRLLGAKY